MLQHVSLFEKYKSCTTAKNRHSRESIVVSVTIIKSYCLCSSDPEKSHCKKNERESPETSRNYVTDVFTVCFLSALLAPFWCIYETVAKLGCFLGRWVVNVPQWGCKFPDDLKEVTSPSEKGGFLAITKVLCITLYELLTKRNLKMTGYWLCFFTGNILWARYMGPSCPKEISCERSSQRSWLELLRWLWCHVICILKRLK